MANVINMSKNQKISMTKKMELQSKTFSLV